MFDLDGDAVAFARAQFQKKNPNLVDAQGWDVATFLNKAKLCISGQVTRTALLLLGKAESAHYLSPAHPQVTWVLRDEKKEERDYHHFGLPLIFVSDELLKRIRNLTVRHLPSGTLFPEEVTQYDPWVIRETLHNCIAHQDYGAGARVSVVETPESLLFLNSGSFIPGTVEHMIESDAPPGVYRNPFLATAMVNMNMVDTIGSGIRRMFRLQRERSFPMPDYDLRDPTQVSVRLPGRIIDEKYTQMLMANADIELIDVIGLDKVQKHAQLDDETFSRLKKRGLIEGRRPNVFVAAKIAAATDSKADFIKNRAFDKKHYSALLVAYLEQFAEASFDDIKKLLLTKLSDALTAKQKVEFIKNLLQEMRREGTVETHGERRWAKWRLSKSGTKAEN